VCVREVRAWKHGVYSAWRRWRTNRSLPSFHHDHDGPPPLHKQARELFLSRGTSRSTPRCKSVRSTCNGIVVGATPSKKTVPTKSDCAIGDEREPRIQHAVLGLQHTAQPPFFSDASQEPSGSIGCNRHFFCLCNTGENE